MSTAQDVINFRIRIKKALVNAFDNKCQLCQQTYPQSVFEFHHLNPAEKSFGLGTSSTTRAKSAYAEEAKKCCMLCANCHRLVEYENANKDNILKCDFNEEKYYQTLEELTQHNKQIQQEKQKEERIKPTKEQLLQDLIDFNGNFSAVGRKYNFSSNAVVKWCKKFNMPYHSSDYKNKS